MTALAVSNKVNVDEIFRGDVVFVPPCEQTMLLMAHAREIAENTFGCTLEQLEVDPSDAGLKNFVENASTVKSTFTNDKKTEEMMRALIRSMYSLPDTQEGYLFDKPRIRIIPNSEVISSGISYNYLPHRDTWYGSQQHQVNHWMSLANVCKDATFYLSPTFFNMPVENTSDSFDLGEWDSKFRKKATDNIKGEDRPHPAPVVDIHDNDRLPVVIEPGWEVVFSGHHMHGSSKNITNRVRFSIDYRVNPPLESLKHIPENLDDRSTGKEYNKYMLPV